MVAIPALSSKVDPEVKRAIGAIVLQLTGVLNGNIPVGYANSAGNTDTVSGGDSTIPTAPTNLVATGAFNYIILTWDHGDDETLISGFEIWRSTTNDIATAVKVGWTPAKIYTDIPSNTSSAVTYYYWVRAVSISGDAGPYNAASGTSASTATDPTYVLEVLAGQVTESELSDSLNERINLISGSGQQFDYKQIWYFDSGVDSWTGNGTPTETDGWLIPADHATDPYVISPDSLGINGVSYGFMMVRIRKTGSPVWDGTIWWQRTEDSTWDAGRSVAVSEPSYDANNIGLISLDTGWTGTIEQVRIDLSDDQSATDYFEIDWVAIGRPAPGASTASVTAEQVARVAGDDALAADIVLVEASISDVSAAVSDEETARINGDSALASDISTLETTVGGHTTSIETNATSIDGLEGQYTVKIDNNGVMAGFGLASTAAKGSVPFSEFYAMADRFAIINPPVSPKVVTSITRSSTTATVTCDDHGFVTGEYRLITNAAQGEYNGIKPITVTGTHTFTYPVAVTASTPATVATGFSNILAGETNAKVPFIVQGGIVYMDIAMIADATITNAKIGDLAVDEAKIGNLAVTEAKIGNLAVTTAKIANADITEAKIANAAVTNAKIANLAVTRAKISDASIDTAHIIDANVTTLKIAGNAVIVPVSSYASSYLSITTTTPTYQTALSVSVTTGYEDLPVLVIVGCEVIITGTVLVQVWRASSANVLFQTAIYSSGTFSFPFIDTNPSASATTYYLKITKSSSATTAAVYDRSITVLGLKR